MQLDSEDLISVTDASKVGVSKLVTEALEGKTHVVMKNNRPAAVIANIEQFERMQRIDDIEQDLRLLMLAVTRLVTDTGERHALDDVAAEFGVDLDDDED